MSGPVQALLWGLLGGMALVMGAAAGYWTRISRRWVAMVMAFGSGVLISALSLELMEEAFARGGWWPSALGFLGGAAMYSAANALLARHGARHRKRSGDQQQGGSGLSIAIGSALDGVPESIAIGVSLLGGSEVSVVTVAAVFLSNLPEGLSSSAGMKNAGRSAAYVFGLWSGIALLCGFSAWIGFVLFDGLPPEAIAITNATAAGAILAMLSDTMIPEAFESAHDYTGLVTVSGFLLAFSLSKLG